MRRHLFALGLFLLIQTIPGATDILVDRDDITVRLAWFYKRRWSVSQVDYATAGHNGLHVFVKGRKRRAFAAMAPLSVGTARDCWRARPGSHPGLALPTIIGPIPSPLRLLAAPVPRTCRGTSRGGRPTSRNTSRGISRAPPRPPCGGLQQICRSPQGFTRRPRPAPSCHPSVFPRA